MYGRLDRSAVDSTALGAGDEAGGRSAADGRFNLLKNSSLVFYYINVNISGIQLLSRMIYIEYFVFLLLSK